MRYDSNYVSKRRDTVRFTAPLFFQKNLYKLIERQDHLLAKFPNRFVRGGVNLFSDITLSKAIGAAPITTLYAIKQ